MYPSIITVDADMLIVGWKIQPSTKPATGRTTVFGKFMAYQVDPVPPPAFWMKKGYVAGQVRSTKAFMGAFRV